MRKCGWDYKYSQKNGFEIIQNEFCIQPSTFVKYYSLKDYNLECLKNKEFYFTHPLNLNDPFDCFRDLVDISKVSLQEKINFYYNNKEIIFTGNSSQSYFEIKERISKSGDLGNTKLFLWHKYFQNLGILSLSPRDNDLLMWSYYNNHEGFAVRFEGLRFDENVFGPFPVNYCEEFEQINLKKLELKNEQLLYISTIKSKLWEHESEWRFILKKEKMSIPDYNTENNDTTRKYKYDYDKRTIILGYAFCRGFKGIETVDKFTDRIIFQENSEKVDLLNFIIDNNLEVELIGHEENNRYELKSKKVKIIMENSNTFLFESI